MKQIAATQDSQVIPRATHGTRGILHRPSPEFVRSHLPVQVADAPNTGLPRT